MLSLLYYIVRRLSRCFRAEKVNFSKTSAKRKFSGTRHRPLGALLSESSHTERRPGARRRMGAVLRRAGLGYDPHLTGWGCLLIKHDCSPFDLFGRYGTGIKDKITDDGWHFYDAAARPPTAHIFAVAALPHKETPVKIAITR